MNTLTGEPLEARIANVLALHSRNHRGKCECGALVYREWQEPTTRARAHLAAMLTPVFADREADAWEEGKRRGLKIADFEYGVSPAFPDITNPYRSTP